MIVAMKQGCAKQPKRQLRYGIQKREGCELMSNLLDENDLKVLGYLRLHKGKYISPSEIATNVFADLSNLCWERTTAICLKLKQYDLIKKSTITGGYKFLGKGTQNGNKD